MLTQRVPDKTQHERLTEAIHDAIALGERNALIDLYWIIRGGGDMEQVKAHITDHIEAWGNGEFKGFMDWPEC